MPRLDSEQVCDLRVRHGCQVLFVCQSCVCHLRGIHTGKTKAFYSARTGGPAADDDDMVESPFEKYTARVLGDYEKWCGKVDTFSPFVYGEFSRLNDVKDQMISGKNNPRAEGL